MPEYGIQTLILAPSHPGKPGGSKVHEYGQFGYGVNVLLLKPSLVIGKHRTTTRDVLHVLIRPSWPAATAPGKAPQHSIQTLLLKPSLAGGADESTQREVCYALMRPCFVAAAAGQREATYAAQVFLLRPSLTSFIERLDKNERAISVLLLRPSVQPADVSYEWHGESGYYEE